MTSTMTAMAGMALYEEKEDEEEEGDEEELEEEEEEAPPSEICPWASRRVRSDEELESMIG